MDQCSWGADVKALIHLSYYYNEVIIADQVSLGTYHHPDQIIANELSMKAMVHKVNSMEHDLRSGTLSLLQRIFCPQVHGQRAFKLSRGKILNQLVPGR